MSAAAGELAEAEVTSTITIMLYCDLIPELAEHFEGELKEFLETTGLRGRIEDSITGNTIPFDFRERK